MKYYAHTAETKTGERLTQEHWQSLPEHLRNVAERAEQSLTPSDWRMKHTLPVCCMTSGKYGNASSNAWKILPSAESTIGLMVPSPLGSRVGSSHSQLMVITLVFPQLGATTVGFEALPTP